MSNYDAAFFAYVNSGAFISAERLLPKILEQIEVKSVLDVGCGHGAWLSIWSNLGVKDLFGLDGDYVDRTKLHIHENFFRATNLAAGFHLNKKFDLVQSLEVAEHLPEASAARFVDSLVAHGDLILFSAAPKGQGGDHHVNEQSYDYWREHFSRHGYVVFDCIRPLVVSDFLIEPWYRYNIFLYASERRALTLPDAIKSCRVPALKKLTDMSPWQYRLRKLLIGILPVSIVTRLAKINEIRVARFRS